MCEIWQSQIHDSPSDGMMTDVLAAINHVTLDIVRLAGEILAGLLDWHLARMLCSFSLLQVLDVALTLWSPKRMISAARLTR